MTLELAAPAGSTRVVIAGSGGLRGRAAEFRRIGLAVVEHDSGLGALRDLRDDTAALLVTGDLPDVPRDALIDIARSLARVPVIVGADAGSPAGATPTVRLPITPQALAAALRSVRRPDVSARHLIERGALIIDVEGFRATWHGAELRLPPRLFDVLRSLAEAAPRTLSYGSLAAPLPGVLDPHERVRASVARIRAALESAAPRSADPIVTVHKVGYRLALPSAESTPGGSPPVAPEHGY